MKIYGSGTGNYANTAQVNDAGFLYVAGSISSMPSLSTTENSVYKMSGTVAIPGSVNLVGGWFNGSAYPLHLETGSNLLVTGSVYQSTSPWTISGTANVSGAVGILTSPGSIGVFAGVSTIFGISGNSVGISGVVNPSPGSNYLLSTPGSVGIYGGVIGSIVISGTVPVTISTNPVPISGNALGVSGTAFQQVWVGVGSIVISGVPIIAGQSGGQVMPLMTTAGSVLQTQPLAGSNYLLTSPGSVGIFAGVSTIFGVSGTVIGISGVTNPTPGSIYHLSSPGSHAVYIDGNVGSVVLSGTSIPVFRGVGSVLGLFTDSSNVLDSPLIAVGSYLMVAGSVSSMPAVSTFGSVAISGNVTVSLAGGSTYPSFDIIRKQAGSPFDRFIFAGVSRSVMVENLGSNSIYVNFNADVTASDSGTMFLYPRDVISLDLMVGSVNIQSSGVGLSTLAQVIGIR